jgi:hypothetical protein
VRLVTLCIYTVILGLNTMLYFTALLSFNNNIHLML